MHYVFLSHYIFYHITFFIFVILRSHITLYYVTFIIYHHVLHYTFLYYIFITLYSFHILNNFTSRTVLVISYVSIHIAEFSIPVRSNRETFHENERTIPQTAGKNEKGKKDAIVRLYSIFSLERLGRQSSGV